jgi:membrane glycosyltransferase
MISSATQTAPRPAASSTPDWTAEPATHSDRRVFLFFTTALLITGLVSLLFADLLWRTGWSTTCLLLLFLFIAQMFLIVVGCLHGVFGFVSRRRAKRRGLSRLIDYRRRDIEGTSTAILIPIYNEEVARVCEGLRAVYLSLAQTGQGDRFDFFILSDSNDPDKWAVEERRWFDLVRELGALGRIHYRRRVTNEGKKSGNIRDFLNTWGRRYRYFIVLDADSIMSGETVVALVQIMEAHPAAGLVQTVPAAANADSLFGRLQQFANRLYGPVFTSGLCYWTQEGGNYWGHNAIVRTEAFMQNCDLPQLPGRKPFGGQILSHDFVEAALLRKADWQVWIAEDLEGSYEDVPQGLIESAQRDRRWCQGNLQHGMLLFAHGLRNASRIHMGMGIMSYLAGPLWLTFLLIFGWKLWFKQHTGLSNLVVRAFTPFVRLNGTQHALLIFGVCMVLLLLPKLLALIELAIDRSRQRSFGGLGRAAAGVLAETVFSTLYAPLQMLWHSKFVATILLGVGVQWGPQKRTAEGLAWSMALRQHWVHTLIGVAWGASVWWLDRPTFWWFVPVLAGMVLSIPLSVFTSRRGWGEAARRLGLFLTPEEVSPPAELAMLGKRMEELAKSGELAPCPADCGLAEVVLDPYLNAIHVSLLREKQLNPVYKAALAKLGAGGAGVRQLAETLLRAGPAALQPQEKLLVMSDADMMSWLHRQAWLRSGEALAEWWRTAIRGFAK